MINWRQGVRFHAVNLTPDEAIRRHLYLEPPDTRGIQYKSSFIALLQDVRGTAERDVDTGHVKPGKQGQSWLAATGYMMLLDQIGTCFKVAGQPVIFDRTALLHALDHFSTVTVQKERDALWALRNAFAHDYALFNPNGKNPSWRHAFLLDANTTDPLVTLPATGWDGSYGNTPTSAATKVNLRALGDMVEDVVATVRRKHDGGRLELRLDPVEFMTRYGIFYRP